MRAERILRQTHEKVVEFSDKFITSPPPCPSADIGDNVVDVRVGLRRQKNLRHELSQRRKPLFVPRTVLLDRENVAPGDRLAGLVDKRLRPSHIVFFEKADFRDPIVDQLPRRVLDRGKGAACDAGAKPLFLGGGKRDCRVKPYHKTLVSQFEVLSAHLFLDATQ